ncbi:26S proteasome non-ATPase regulatory subunit [Dimargaris verticillata]|uniref:26S proteasome regulatory subunit RPN3 n=1 Tax=Dimargaris verticillata TaxID=2761393 RepID=A0A9W8AZN0_9FUNG|nr:26S proteasome non-ATPase regulatory subunit [Dimargaris verticillata]
MSVEAVASAMEVEPTSPNVQMEEKRSRFETDLNRNITFLKKAVTSLETRYLHRVLRTIPSMRKRLDRSVLAKSIQLHFLPEFGDKEHLLKLLEESGVDMEVEQPLATSKGQQPVGEPEVSAYLCLLVMIYLLDSKQNAAGMALAESVSQRVVALNRRTLDPIAAKIFFYCARFYEVEGRLADIRASLMAHLRTATLRHDDELQATLLNLILRNLLHYNLYDQAQKLVSKATFPESASNSQMARYMYYQGRIKAIELDYSDAHTFLLQAQRKAPQTHATAGFHQAVQKLFVIVQLLMGEIPERSIFRQPVLRKALAPYLSITQAVRVGDLSKFQATLACHEGRFRADKTYTLILRLRHNVIKAGIRMISLSYLRIPLRDVCIKLHLDSEEDAEYIVSKAIRDGVIDATIDHERGFIQTKEVADVYATSEPQETFNQRIQFCLKLYNESVKALRFPLNAHKKDLESTNEALEREREIVNEFTRTEFKSDEESDLGEP